nr:DMT family transporter [Bordetella genomosp. 13]
MTPGLILLAISVMCSVTVSVLLKLARRHDVDVRQAFAANYAVAAVLCWAMLAPQPAQALSTPGAWWLLAPLAILMPTVFMAMAQSVRHAGIVRSDAAQRLALFIPLLAAFALFGEQLTTHKLAGIALAFGALACLLRRPRNDAAAPDATRGAWLWPVAVMVGYGVIDVLYKQMARAGSAFPGTMLVVFILAGLVTTLYLLARRVQWQWRSLGAGVILGLFNFANIITYIKAHQSLPGNPALVFASMNMGVITLGTVVGALVFRERLSALNLFGLVLALSAIVVMMPR